MPKRRSKKSDSCIGTALMIGVVFAILRGCATGCSSSLTSATKTSVLGTLSEDQIMQTLIAEIQLSYTPTTSPTFTNTPIPTQTIALLNTLELIPTQPAATSAAVEKYIVQNGDTCWSIAVDKYKIPLDAFLAANGISAAYCDISVGQEVVIPAADYPVPTALPYAAPTSAPVYIAPTAAPVYAAPAVVAPSENECNPNYVGVCLPMYGNVRCKDIEYTRFRHNGYDPFGLDRDGDGICCEGN